MFSEAQFVITYGHAADTRVNAAEVNRLGRPANDACLCPRTYLCRPRLPRTLHTDWSLSIASDPTTKQKISTATSIATRTGAFRYFFVGDRNKERIKQRPGRSAYENKCYDNVCNFVYKRIHIPRCLKESSYGKSFMVIHTGVHPCISIMRSDREFRFVLGELAEPPGHELLVWWDVIAPSTLDPCSPVLLLINICFNNIRLWNTM